MNYVIYCLVHYIMRPVVSPGPIISDFNLDRVVKIMFIRFIHYKEFFYFLVIKKNVW